MSKLANTSLNLPDGWVVRETDACGGMARYEAPDGTIELAYFEVMPGAVLTRIDLACQTLPADNPLGAQLATINWCAAGRCEVDFGERGTLVVGERTLCLSSALALSFSYPTGAYRGFEFFVDLDQIDAASWALLGAFGLTPEALRRILLQHDLGVTLLPGGELAEAIHAIELELALARPRPSWLLLGTCRLLMVLAQTDLEACRMAGFYLRRSQRDMAQLVHQRLTERFAPKANLASLAKELGVSEASLRSYFVRVYGQSPASFVRARALGEAARLLREADLPVADVSQACGYANPSKFSAAFSRAYGANPLEYRRRARLG